MKVLKKVIALIIIMIITSSLINTTQKNVFANLSLNAGSRNIVNVSVLLYSFEDLFMMSLKQSLEEIERENRDKIRFTFYD